MSARSITADSEICPLTQLVRQTSLVAALDVPVQGETVSDTVGDTVGESVGLADVVTVGAGLGVPGTVGVGGISVPEVHGTPPVPGSGTAVGSM